MYHIGISGRHPPLPDASQLSEAGIDFLTLCFARPAKERPSATELLDHEWMRDVDENALYSEFPSGSPSAPSDSAGILSSSTSSTASPFFRTQSSGSGSSLQLKMSELE
jgi:serine/threonine protein kinase